MKIFFAFSASSVDDYLSKKTESTSLSYSESIHMLLSRSLFNSLHCSNQTIKGHYLSIFNSVNLQQKWAKEKKLPWEDDWMIRVLGAQIEEVRPDVIYTNNPAWFSQHYQQLPEVKLRAAWRAAPIGAKEEFSCFQLGLSYAPHFLNLMKDRGVANLELLQFSFDPSVKDRVSASNKDIDVCFVGRYIKMFSKRNHLLKVVYQNFRSEYNIVYHLLTGRRLKGLIPDLPFGMLGAYHKPVFLDDLISVFMRSKIVINAHSDIAAQYKGNMRVFEALGTETFMLSDAGNYPEYLVAGQDFATYENEEDMIEKIAYYLNNADERQKIASNGYNKIKKHYPTEEGFSKLVRLFGKYL